MSRYRINAGEYRHVVTFQTREDKRNKYGEVIESWKNSFKARVGIYPISGREFYAAETVNSEVTHKLNMRYMPNQHISPDMRIDFNGRILQIISVINFQEKNVELQLLCKELI